MADDSEFNPLFTTQPSAAFYCPVCKDVMRDAVITHCCHNTYCRTCIYQALVINSQCPLCRAKVTMGDVYPNITVQSLLEELSVFCPFQSEGCKEQMSLGEMQSHTSQCRFALLRCEYWKQGCTYRGSKEEREAHVANECAFEKVKEYIEAVEAETLHLRRTVEEQTAELRTLRARLAEMEAVSGGVARPVQRTGSASEEGGPLSPVADSRVSAEYTCRYTLSGHSRGVTALCTGEHFLYSGSQDATIIVWDWDSFNLRTTLKGHKFTVWSIVEVGRTLFSASSDYTIRVWNLDDFQCTHVLEGHTGKIYTAVLCPSHGYLASGASDRSIRLWNLETLECDHHLANVHERGVTAIKVVDNILYSSSEDGLVHATSLDTLDRIRSFEGNDSSALALALTETHLFASSNCAIKVWDLQSGEVLATLEGHRWQIWQLLVAGGWLVSASFDHKIKVWNTSTFSCETTLEGHVGYIHSIAGKDGMLFSGSGDRTIKVWANRH